MDKLIVKNFGPIKDIAIDVNDVNIFIGPTSSGKSTVAKLIAIFSDDFFMSYPSIQNFEAGLLEYSIDFIRSNETEIQYVTNDGYYEVNKYGLNHHSESQEEIRKIYDYERLFKNSINPVKDGWYIKLASDLVSSSGIENQFTTNDSLIQFVQNQMNAAYNKIKKQCGFYNIVYIPAERILLSSIQGSLFGLMKNDVSIAQCIKEFGALFETARKNLAAFDISFLNAEYEYSDNNDYLTLSDGTRIKLAVASSGLQSTVPLMVVIDHSCGAKELIGAC